MKNIGLKTYTDNEIPVWDFTKPLTRVLGFEPIVGARWASQNRIYDDMYAGTNLHKYGRGIWATIAESKEVKKRGHNDPIPDGTPKVCSFSIYAEKMPYNVGPARDLNGEFLPWCENLYVYHGNTRTYIHTYHYAEVYFGDW